MLTVLLIVGGGGYAVSLLIHPFTRCRWCRGAGRHVGAFYGFAHRPCRHCGGSGRRPRSGRRFVGGTPG